jgi:hypothetical protein
MFRPIALTALSLLLIASASPAVAQDDFTRQLINQCVGCRFPKDLHGRDLHGLRFVGADLRGVDFSHANLNGAVFTGCDLENAKFDDADLRNARFVGAQLAGATFTRAKMDGITLHGADFGSRGSGTTSYRSFRPWVLGDADDYSKVISADVQRSLRTLAEHPPTISPEVERALRNLAAHPPTISPEMERTLRDLQRQVRDMRDDRWIIVPPPAPPAPPPPVRP